VHLVSGKTLDVIGTTTIWLLQNAVLILERPIDRADEGEYNMVSLRNIERLERIGRAM
jgi:hypothetical protein